MRRVDEFRHPFESKESPVRKAGLSLISIETKVIPCPKREKWLKNGGDPKEFARWYTPAIRSWSNTTFISGELATLSNLLLLLLFLLSFLEKPSTKPIFQNQEPITQSLHTVRILESTLSCICFFAFN